MNKHQITEYLRTDGVVCWKIEEFSLEIGRTVQWPFFYTSRQKAMEALANFYEGLEGPFSDSARDIRDQILKETK